MKIKPLMRDGLVLKSKGEPSYFIDAEDARRNRWVLYHRGRAYVGTEYGYQHIQKMIDNLYG